MTILQSLKKLHKKMTGQETTNKTIGGVLDSMQENYNGGSSSGDTYETVAEIAVGTMEHGDWYTYEEENVTPPEISSDITYYLNDEKMPSETVMDEGGMYGIIWNTEDVEEGEPIDPSKPIVMVAWMNGDCHVMSDTDLSNETVKILKKVSGGSSLPDMGGQSGKYLTNNGTEASWGDIISDEFVVTANLILGQGSMSFSDVSEDYDDIFAAMLNGKSVRFHAKYESEQLNATVDASLTFTANLFNNIYGLGVVNNGGHVEQVLVNIYSEDDSTYASATFIPFLPSVGNNGQILGISNGAYTLVDDYKPSYEFPFTITEDQQQPGEYDITPGSGVTYAAIAAAMQVTPNVYAIIDFDGENRYLFTDIDTTNGVIRATGLYYGEIDGTYMFVGLRIKVMSDNSCDIAVKPLQTASQ